jgi:hypothetical protein
MLNGPGIPCIAIIPVGSDSWQILAHLSAYVSLGWSSAHDKWAFARSVQLASLRLMAHEAMADGHALGYEEGVRAGIKAHAKAIVEAILLEDPALYVKMLDWGLKGELLGPDVAKVLEVVGQIRREECSWAWAAEALGVDLADLKRMLAEALDMRQVLPTS